MTKEARLREARLTIDEERLLRVSASLFRKKGFAATSLREIAQAAEILPGSLHYRYPSKDSLLLALMERGIDCTIATVRKAVEQTQDPTERVRLALRAHLSMLLSGDDCVYVLLYEWRSLTGEMREAMIRQRDRYEAFWDGMLYEAAGTGRIRPGIDLRLVRLFGFGAINWIATWYAPEGKGHKSPDELADTFWEYLTLGLLAEEKRPETRPEQSGGHS